MRVLSANLVNLNPNAISSSLKNQMIKKSSINFKEETKDQNIIAQKGILNVGISKMKIICKKSCSPESVVSEQDNKS